MKTQKILRFIIICAVISGVFFLTSCQKQEQIKEIMVIDDTTNLLVYARLQDPLKEEMIKLVRAGVPIHCAFYVEFYKEKSFRDIRLTHKIVKNVMKYDNVKKNATVVTALNGQIIEKAEFYDIDSAQLFMLEINSIPLIATGSLDPQEKFYVKIKAKIGKEQYSLLNRYVSIFLPFMEEQTKWHRKDFIWEN